VAPAFGAGIRDAADRRAPGHGRSGCVTSAREGDGHEIGCLACPNRHGFWVDYQLRNRAASRIGELDRSLASDNHHCCEQYRRDHEHAVFHQGQAGRQLVLEGHTFSFIRVRLTA